MNTIVEELLNREEKVVFQLFELITEGKKYEQWTDKESYIILQSDSHAPIWIWMDKKPEQEKQYEIVNIIKERVSANPNVHVNAVSDRFSPLLPQLNEQTGMKTTVVMPMNVYVCTTPYNGKEQGHMIMPQQKHVAAMKELLIQLVNDAEHENIPDEAAENFADSMIASDKLFLWEDEGEICAMAMIAHRGEHLTRINTVVTERNKRGRGYAGMLVAAICRAELQCGYEVMLYADATNPSSNRAYQKIGFQQVGEITEYKFVDEQLTK